MNLFKCKLSSRSRSTLWRRAKAEVSHAEQEQSVVSNKSDAGNLDDDGGGPSCVNFDSSM